MYQFFAFQLLYFSTSILFITFFLTISTYNLAQVKIKERVEIIPGSTVTEPLPNGSISGDTRNPLYLGYGGEVTLRKIHISNPGLELWEESLGKLTISGVTSIGEFPQWHKLIFYLLNQTTGEKIYTEHSAEIVWEYGSSIDFYPTHQPGDPYPYNPEDWWEIEVNVNNSLAAMPPTEILNYLGNPFIPTEPLEVPIDGSLYAVITYVGYENNTQDDELWIDIPGTELLQDNIGSYEYEIIDLGDMNSGETIRFYLRTQNSIVNGMNLYPLQIREEMYMPDGDILMWRLEFADWTDLWFDDVKVEVYLTPDSLGANPVSVTIEPGELAPGDTAEIIIKRRYLDGTLEDYPEEQLFELGMIEGCEGGQILVGDSLGVYFEEALQPVKFVADTNVTDSVKVGIRVGLIEEIIGSFGKVKDGDKDYKKNEEKTALNKRERSDYELIMKSKRKGNRLNGIQGNRSSLPDNPTQSYCFTGDFYADLYEEAEVVVTDEEIEILLGELKFFGVKKKLENGTVNEIKIEEIVVEEGETPIFPNNAGEGWEWIEEDSIWSNRPINIETKGSSPIFYDRFYSQVFYTGTQKPIINYLPNGMIRIIGRYLGKNPDNKVKLFTSVYDNSYSDTLEIKVIRP